MGGVLLIAVVVLGSFAGEGESELDLPMGFALDPGAYRIDAPDSAVEGGLSEAHGLLTLHGGRTPMFLVPVLLLLPVMAVIVLVLHRLRRVLRRLVRGRPFAPGNAGDLRFIGLAVIVGELVLAAFSYASARYLMDRLSTTGITLNAAFEVRMPVILAGAVLFVVAEVFREGAAMKADLEAAREIQFSLVAETEVRSGAVSIHAEMQPADSVGGDYYDVIELGGGRLAFVLADVAGHGLPAALLMALLQGSLRSLVSAGLRGAELVERVNTYLVANTPGNRMVTFFYGELDPSTGALTYVNAGHNPPYLIDGSSFDRLGSTSVVLGSFDGASFTNSAAVMPAGSRLVLFTDGITEAANAGDEEFGEERLEELLAGNAATGAAGFIERTFRAVHGFRGKAAQADDMTLMVVDRESARAG